MFFTPSQGPEITWDVIEDKYLIVTVCGIYDAADLLASGKDRCSDMDLGAMRPSDRRQGSSHPSKRIVLRRGVCR